MNIRDVILKCIETSEELVPGHGFRIVDNGRNVEIWSHDKEYKYISIYRWVEEQSICIYHANMEPSYWWTSISLCEEDSIDLCNEIITEFLQGEDIKHFLLETKDH